MRKFICVSCNKETGLNETVKVDGKAYCNDCFEIQFSDRDKLQGSIVEREIDPTVCANCNKDFGETELNKIATFPVCSECEIAIKKRTFPAWVKAFFIGILVIVVVAFIWNWKFYTAYQNIDKANASFQEGDYAGASLLMKSASEKVPEVEDLKTLAGFYNGIDLLAKDKCAEAEIEFENISNKLPPDFNINTFKIQARLGAAFNNQDYQGFLDASKDYLAMDSTLAYSLTSVASAYACLYASQGKDEYKLSALQYLQRAKQADSTSEEMKSYYNMVEYRIFTRKIIRREEFNKQFPNGWTKN